MPYSVAVGDLNGDGKPDLVTVNSGSNTVSVLLGYGDGTFGEDGGVRDGEQPPVRDHWGPRTGTGIPIWPWRTAPPTRSRCCSAMATGPSGRRRTTGTGSLPASVALGDLNGDGKPDLAVANYSSSTVSVLLGNGDWDFGFGAKTDFGTGSYPYSVAIGDLNGDGKPDLAVANDRLQHGLGAARQRRRDLRGEDGLRDREQSPVRRDRGPERGREARSGDGELRLQHGLGAARQRRRDLRGEDRLRNGEKSLLHRDRGPERGREARPGGGERGLQHGLGAAGQRRRDASGRRRTTERGCIPIPWRSGT